MTISQGISSEEMQVILENFYKYARNELPFNQRMLWDKDDIVPIETIKKMMNEEVGFHLVFLPEEYGGLGGNLQNAVQFAESMATVDIGISTTFLATLLGLEPLLVFGTEQQKGYWLTRCADEGLIAAYAVTEADAGSNLAAITTTARRVTDENGSLRGYELNGSKQFISNGGIADIYTVLAIALNGPSFFLIERGTKGLETGRHEDKHGIRLANTAPLTLKNVFVPRENIIGEVEGDGLKQAARVFNTTRLAVGSIAIGGALSALKIAIEYSKKRVQFGNPLIEMKGYTHKLIVPNYVRLKATKNYIDNSASRYDQGIIDLQLEGSIAKYFASETANRAAEDAIQALGGYGYIREYEVEKIKRDVRITTIYEGTSEIQQNIISLLKWKQTVKLKGANYDELYNQLRNLSGVGGSDILAICARVLKELILWMHKNHFTRQQHLMFQLSDIVTWVEIGSSMCLNANNPGCNEREREENLLISRIIAVETLQHVSEGWRIVIGYGLNQGIDIPIEISSVPNFNHAENYRNFVADMDALAEHIKSGTSLFIK